MTQEQRRLYLIQELLKERPDGAGIEIPTEQEGQKRLLRSLFNLRQPQPASQEFLAVQDAYLQEETRRKGVTSLAQLRPVEKGLYLWQGDITTLACGAIVNAANSQLLGCFYPCHGCIDNAIHTYSGVQLRLECAQLMARQGHPESTGQAKVTQAYNLPCQYVLHTVGPIITGRVTSRDEALLVACYRACLEAAQERGIPSVAFCCPLPAKIDRKKVKATPHNKAKRTVLLARSFWQNGLRLEFSQKAYGFKPPGRACQPEADSPTRI